MTRYECDPVPVHRIFRLCSSFANGPLINYRQRNTVIAMNVKDTKTLISSILNDDDAEISRIVGARFEAEFRRQLTEASRAVFESIGKPVKPVVG